MIGLNYKRPQKVVPATKPQYVIFTNRKTGEQRVFCMADWTMSTTNKRPKQMQAFNKRTK